MVFKSSGMFRVLFALIGIALLVSIACLAWVLKIQRYKNEHTAKLCVKALLFSKEFLQVYKHLQIKESSEICFSNETEFLERILEDKVQPQQKVQQEFNYRQAYSKFNFSPVSAHKNLQNSLKSSQASQDSFPVTHHWTLTLNPDITSLFEHVRGAHVTQEGLHILYSGLYYVYMNVIIKQSHIFWHKTSYVYLHRVSPNSPSTSGILLRSVYTFHKADEVQESGFLGGVFHLLQGDLLQICVSQENSVFNSSSNSIGFFLLTSL